MIPEIKDIGIRENENQHLKAEVLKGLLVDYTLSIAERERTGNAHASVNRMWGTSDYEHLGKGYECHSQIVPELVTDDNANIVKPRVMKSKLNRRSEARKWQRYSLKS